MNVKKAYSRVFQSKFGHFILELKVFFSEETKNVPSVQLIETMNLLEVMLFSRSKCTPKTQRIKKKRNRKFKKGLLKVHF